jgi:N-acyl-D-amino-acid deacylase
MSLPRDTSLRCDLILRDATIFDGTGAARSRGDVAVRGDRIVGVGDLGAMAADREVMATGMAVAPGFIDAHTHDDRAVLCGPECMLCKMSQGVSTVVVGNCGISLSPVKMSKRPVPPLDLLGDESWWTFGSFGEYADRRASAPAPGKTYALIGHMSLRVGAMNGDTQRAASDAEAAQMEKRLGECLAEGASGVSTGLYDPPNMMAPTSEVIAVAQALRAAGGIYVSHMRDEASLVLDSINETAEIGRGAGVPVVISHHKCSMPENFGRSVETLALIERLAAQQSVAFDIYPYYAGSTVLMADRVRPDVPIKIAWSVPHPEMEGRMLAEIAQQWNTSLKEAAERLLPAGAIMFQMDEPDVQRIMKHPLSMIGSDGLPHDKFPHPRLWGCFPRVLGHYSRKLKLFSMETAVHKMTGRVAEVFGIVDRGVIREGAYADLVLFDPATVKDAADFDHPTRPAIGILETWVNGQSAYVLGQGATEARAGRLVSRNKA